MPKRQPRITACETRTQDYPSIMALFEKESLAAEAKLKIEKKTDQLERLFRLQDPRGQQGRSPKSR
jgi:hypothetical protein